MERFHFRPVHFRPEMMFGVIAVVEKKPVIEFAVTAHSPSDRLIGIAAIVAKITIQITETVTEIKERQEIKNYVAPVQKEHHEQHCGERRELDIPPH